MQLVRFFVWFKCTVKVDPVSQPKKAGVNDRRLQQKKRVRARRLQQRAAVGARRLQLQQE